MILLYTFQTKEDLIKFFNEEVINTADVSSLLNCSRQYVSQLVREQKLIPIKSFQRDNIFLKSDVIDFMDNRAAKK